MGFHNYLEVLLMSLAIVSEITQRFKAAVAKWQVDISEPLECRFLLRNGNYVGHVLTWGSYRGVWFCDPGELKVYRDQQWLLTMPLPLGEGVPAASSKPVRSSQKSAA